MATKLEKNLVRESTVKVDDREILVTLTADQKISMKLKGMRTGEVSINIEELWYQLNGGAPVADKKVGSVSIDRTAIKSSKTNPMMSLNDIRSANAISALDYPTLVKFDGIIKGLIDMYPETYGKKQK